MTQNPSPSPRTWIYRLAYLAMVIGFVVQIARYYHPDYGYGYLSRFGDRFENQATPRIVEQTRFVEPNSTGYDGQFYSQLALYPSAIHPDLSVARTFNHYRTRRILFCWTAYGLGLGNEAWIFQAYNFQNALFWLASASLLLRWLPPTSFQNALRYFLCLFTLGMVESWNRALLDGPAMAVMLIAMFFLEKGHKLGSALSLAIGGIGKETNILAAAMLPLPKGLTGTEAWKTYISRGILVALPISLWIAFLYSSAEANMGDSHLLGHRNFDWPFKGLLWAIGQSLDANPFASFEAFFKSAMPTLLCLATQAGYLMARPDLRSAWWRLGIAYVVLMAFLGGAVWEGVVPAVARVMLPMTFAFTILLPKRTALLPLLIAANLTSFMGITSLKPFLPPGASVIAQADLTDRQLDFSSGWYGYETLDSSYWRWSNGHSQLRIVNLQDKPTRLVFEAKARSETLGELVLTLNDKHSKSVHFDSPNSQALSWPIELQKGVNVVRFDIQYEAARLERDERQLGFCLVEYVLREFDPVTSSLGSDWYSLEQSGDDYWAWSPGSSSILLRNHDSEPIEASIAFTLSSLSERPLSFSFRNEEIAATAIPAGQKTSVSLDLELEPGLNEFVLQTRAAPDRVEGDSRDLAFCLHSISGEGRFSTGDQSAFRIEFGALQADTIQATEDDAKKH